MRNSRNKEKCPRCGVMVKREELEENAVCETCKRHMRLGDLVEWQFFVWGSSRP